MKRNFDLLRIVMVLGVAGWVGQTLAAPSQDDIKSKTRSGDVKKGKSKDKSKDKSKGKHDKDEGRKGRRARRPDMAEKLEDLREMMHEHFKLADQQKSEIDAIFDERISELQAEREARRNRSGDKQHDPQRAEIAQLRRDLTEARESGDKERIQAALEALRALREAQADERAEETRAFVQRVKEHLNANQAVEFDDMVRSLRIGVQRQGAEAGLRKLLRAVTHREVGLTDQQHAQIREVRKSIRAARHARAKGESSSKDPETVATEYETQILNILTAEQRAKVDELMAQRAQRAKQRAKGRPHPRDRETRDRERTRADDTE